MSIFEKSVANATELFVDGRFSTYFHGITISFWEGMNLYFSWLGNDGTFFTCPDNSIRITRDQYCFC